MSISYPRDLPFSGLFTGECAFDLMRVQTRSLTGGAAPNVADIGPPYWVGKWSTRVLSRAEFDEWDAWLASLRGGLRLFKGRPNRQRWPRAYPRGFAGLTVSASPFSGSGNLATIGENRDTVTVDALPDGFVLGYGDMLSIPVGSRQHLHKIIEGGTATAGSVSLTVEPPIRPGVETAIAALFDTPYCEMSISTESKSRDPIKGGTISFEAQQILV